MTSVVQKSFNAGELSPQLYGRPDLAKYPNGVKQLLNFISLPHGPATRRTGTEFIARTKDHSKANRLVDYEFSTEQAYVIEFGENYIRFFKDGGQIIEKTATITGATQANPVVVTGTNTFVNGEIIRISAVKGMTELNEQEFIVANATGANFELTGIDGTAYGAYTSGGDADKPYTVTTTYTEAELEQIDFASLNDVIYIAHKDHLPATLTRSGHTSWALSDIEFQDGPWISINSSTTTLTPAGATGTVTFTASAITGINNDTGFQTTDIGRLVRILNGSDWTWGKITARASTTQVSVELKGDVDFPTAAVTDWRLGNWCESLGYPSTVTLDNDRLWWAASPYFPMRLWGSKVGIYNDHGFSDPVVSDDALNLDLAAKQANAIQWITSGRKFAAGTTGSEFWLTNAAGEGAITATSKQAVPGSFNGASSVKPIMIGGTLLFLQRQGKILRELKYDFSSDSFEGEDLSVLAEHLTRNNTIVDMAYQREPYKILWCVRDDGVLLGFTYYAEHEVYGWHPHSIGGDGIVESVCVISGSNEDELWLTVRRTIDGSTVRYIERLHESFTGDDTVDAFFVDSGLTLDNRQDVESISYADPGVISLTGHGYLNGDVVTFRSIDDVIDGEEDYLSIHRERWTVANKTADTFELVDDDAAAVDLSEYKQVVSCTVAKNQTIITGLAHLEGEEVTILADGSPVSEKTVTNSQITLDTMASVVHVGLYYYSQLRTFPPYLQTTYGESFAKMQRITNVIMQLYKTLGFLIGPSESKLFDYDFISDAIPLGQAGPLYDGFTSDISFDGEFSRSPSVYIRQAQPLPLTILSIFTDFETED